MLPPMPHESMNELRACVRACIAHHCVRIFVRSVIHICYLMVSLIHRSKPAHRSALLLPGHSRTNVLDATRKRQHDRSIPFTRPTRTAQGVCVHAHACEDNCLTDDLSINAWSEVKSRFVVATHLSIAAHVHKRGKTNTNKNSCTSFGRMAISSNANKIFCILLNICYFLLNTYLKNNTRDSLLIIL